MKKYLYCALCVFACSCYPQHPLVKEAAANNTTYKVEYLFEHEGCKVYRFLDRGNYIYYTNCNGEAITRTDSTAIHNSIHVNKN
jgi:hypothetical protein